MEHLINIALVMLTSGILGGLVNSYLTDPADENFIAWWKHIVVGVAASFMVPLFLNMISGDLIDKIRGIDDRQPDYSKLFVLAGFCLVAAVSSRAFIRTLSERVLQEVKSAKKKAEEAKEVAADAKAAVAPFIEVEAQDEIPAFNRSVNEQEENTPTNNELTTLKAMTNSSYSLRSISGIAKDSGLSKQLVNASITSLISKGLVAQTESSTGQPRWYPTPEGRAKVQEFIGRSIVE